MVAWQVISTSGDVETGSASTDESEKGERETHLINSGNTFRS
jgi:hypothetical protein